MVVETTILELGRVTGMVSSMKSGVFSMRVFGFAIVVGLSVVIAAVQSVKPAFAVESVPRLALVIGNSDYEFGPLKNPVNDAALMTRTLRGVGFEVFEYLNADQRTMKRAIVNFSRDVENAGKDAVALVYFAGHGVQVNGENYMIPVGASIEDEVDVDIEAVRASSLLIGLREARSKLNIVILDACRNNPFASGSRSAARGLARMDAPTGTLLAYSTAPGQVASDGTGKNSPYTTALTRAIREEGAKVEEVFKTVRVSVMERTNASQVPWESSSLTGDFYFVPSTNVVLEEKKNLGTLPSSALTAPPQSENALDVEYWKSVSLSQDPELIKSYLDRFPNGVFNDVARQRIASLTAPPFSNTNQELMLYQSIQLSDEPVEFERFLDVYPNGTFSALAKARLAKLRAAQSTQAAEAERQRERALWDSVKNSQDRALFEAFLQQYPDGLYSGLARAKLSSLSNASAPVPAAPAPSIVTQPTVAPQPAPTPAPAETQVAALGPNNPRNGILKVDGWVTHGRTMGTIFCTHNERVTGTIEIEEGVIKSELKSSLGAPVRLSGLVSPSGKVSMKFRSLGWTDNGRVSGQVFGGSFTARSSPGAGCSYEFTVSLP